MFLIFTCKPSASKIDPCRSKNRNLEEARERMIIMAIFRFLFFSWLYGLRLANVMIYPQVYTKRGTHIFGREFFEIISSNLSNLVPIVWIAIY
jgi:hypothetical protein